MDKRIRATSWSCLLPILWMGCAGIRLPAIDPSGQRIFLPAPYSTTFDPTFTGGNNPAFPTPPPLPPPGDYGPFVPYNDGDPALLAGPWGLGLGGTGGTTSQPPTLAPGGVPSGNVPQTTAPYLEGPGGFTDGHVARLSINPRRIVAPVGKEVILVAGLCGADGYFVQRQPIEWTITPDSVGSIVEVDQTWKPLWRHLLRKGPKKISGQYAMGLTSSHPQALPRGTPDPADDIRLVEGQTWISVSSQTEGATQISAVAPTTAGWEERRDHATVYWVDGQWTLPTPITAGTSGGVLRTTVARATTGSPVPGWRVRYDIVGGTPAAFDTAGAQAIEVETNTDGVAAVTIVPLGGYGGTTQVQVQVIRVGTSPGDLAKLVVGQGTTSVTWVDDGSTTPAPVTVIPGDTTPPSLPRVSLRIDGPSVAAPDSIITYTITVTNLGTTPAEGIEVVNTAPRELEFLRASPSSGQFGDEIRWQLAGILPGDSRAIAVDYRVRGSGQIRNCVRASLGSTSVDHCAITDIGSVAQSATLSIQLRGPTGVQVAVGESVAFEIVLSNLGSVDVNSVSLEDQFDLGLEHAAGGSPLSWDVGTIPAGATRSYPIRFTVRNAGRLCHEVTARWPGGTPVSSRACVDAIDARSASPPAITPGVPGYPGLRIEVRGPAASGVGRQEQFEIFVVNTGSQPLTDIRVRATGDDELELQSTLPEASKVGENSAEWTVRSLDVGGQSRLRLLCVVRGGRPRACLQVVAATAEAARGDQSACVNIASQPSISPPSTPGAFDADRAAPSPIFGGTSASGLSVRVERQTTGIGTAPNTLLYRIDVTNNGREPQSEVTLRVMLPDGTEYLTSRTPPAVSLLEISPDRSTLAFRPIITLRAGETVSFSIEVRQSSATVGRMTAEITSLEDRNGTSATD